MINQLIEEIMDRFLFLFFRFQIFLMKPASQLQPYSQSTTLKSLHTEQLPKCNIHFFSGISIICQMTIGTVNDSNMRLYNFISSHIHSFVIEVTVEFPFSRKTKSSMSHPVPAQQGSRVVI